MAERRPLQFVDTNILVYAHDLDVPDKRRAAAALLNTLWDDNTGVTSVQVLQEMYVTLTQKVKRRLSPEDASQLIAVYSAWPIHRPDVSDLLSAVQLQGRYKLSFWDSMIVQSAIAQGCVVLWTADLDHGSVIGPLRVQNPFR